MYVSGRRRKDGKGMIWSERKGHIKECTQKEERNGPKRTDQLKSDKTRRTARRNIKKKRRRIGRNEAIARKKDRKEWNN